MRLIKEYQPDVIDIHLGGIAMRLGYFAGVLTGIPLIWTVYHPPDRGHGRIMGRIFGRKASLVITDSAVRKQEICDWLGIHVSRVSVIPTAVSPPPATRPVQEMLEYFSLEPDSGRSIVGQIGRLIPFKGQMVLLDAAASVLRKFPDTMFLIVGFGTPRDRNYPARLMKRAEELGIQGQVRISGYPGNIGDVWQIVDVHAHASLFDSLPVSIIEGMSLGKPAVVTATGGIPDLVKQRETGIVVQPGDAESLANGLCALLGNPNLSRKLGAAAKERYTSLYDPATLARELENAFRMVARSSSSNDM